MKLWTRPECYMGATWNGWYVFLGRHRDSDLLTNSNFECALDRVLALATEVKDGDDELMGVQKVRENHWAVCWVEWIAIHESQTEAIAKAEKIEERLENYPILNEEDYSSRQWEAYLDAWRFCGAREFVRELEKAELINEGALDDCGNEKLLKAFEALIPSGEYFDYSDGSPNIRYAIEKAKRDGLSDDICGILNLE